MLDVARGSVLLVFSDGVVERREQDLPPPQAALAALLASCDTSTAAAVCGAVTEEVGAGSAEDVTVVAALLG